MKILLISGPPASGKDTAIHRIHEQYPVLEEKFALPLRKAMRGLLDVNDDTLEWMKRDDPRVRLVMIKLSEEIVKHLYGREWFGYACARRVENEWAKSNGNLNVVVTDAGFNYEVTAFCEAVREFAPECQFRLWQLTRPFCSYDNDSREKVVLPAQYGETCELRNFHGLEEFKGQVTVSAAEFFDE